jgi:hypothetical protein
MKDFTSYAAQRATKYSTAFGEPINAASWDNAWSGAEGERAVMVAAFHVWLIQKRHETERDLMSAQAYQRSIAAFAQAGLETAPTPRAVPMCVLEFAQSTLSVMHLTRTLALLNSYYPQAASNVCETWLDIDTRNESEVSQLWQMFLDERNKAKLNAQAK